MRPEETQSETDTPVIVEFKQYGGENSFLIGITRSHSNDVYADKVPDLSFNGNKMGFIVDGEAEIAVERTRSQIFGFGSKL